MLMQACKAWCWLYKAGRVDRSYELFCSGPTHSGCVHVLSGSWIVAMGNSYAMLTSGLGTGPAVYHPTSCEQWYSFC
jgi:hypothetical protein